MAEDLTNPVWRWMFDTRITPWGTRDYFNSGDCPNWTCSRFGQSKTVLPDQTTIWIGGEHEDYYDPDFFIYNDVIVKQPDGTVRFLGYGEQEFPPTDFHTATLYDNGSKILLIGNLGYSQDRKRGTTQVLSLDLSSYSIKTIECSGTGPGWVHKHKATAEPDGNGIVISSGIVDNGESLLENIDQWRLDIAAWQWTQLTDRKWQQFAVHREDKKPLNLFGYSCLEFDLKHRGLASVEDSDLAAKLGITSLPI